MGLNLPIRKLEKILSECTELSSTGELVKGDRVVMSVGTWCCRFPNDDWRWIKGYVKSVTPSGG